MCDTGARVLRGTRFASAENFRCRALAAVDTATPPARWLLLTMKAVLGIDVTAAGALQQLCDELDRRHVVPALARVEQDLMPDLRHSGVSKRIGANRIFPTLPTAVDGYKKEQRRPLPDMP
ncbi:sodium-independent anion transporter [Pseudonocardia sp. CA-142604]|uniref:sodium-independent anion transporter n=1 Tax=Pseudonocardia sp. CA-142604 TaxID=3240024 RepID=UPI003D90D11A